MRNKLVFVFPRCFFQAAVVFALILLVGLAEATAQTITNSSDKPILVAEWTKSESSPKSQTPISVRSLAQSRVVANTFGQRRTSLKPTAFEEQAFALVNEKRSLQNLQLLEWDQEMLCLAREHSENMAKLNFFSHQGTDGKTVADRSEEIGVTDWSMIGENIAFNQGIKNSVEFSIERWLASPFHKENLFGKKWTRSGIGIALTTDGKFYMTQVFRN